MNANTKVSQSTQDQVDKGKVVQVSNCGNCWEASSTIVLTSGEKKVRCMHPMAYSHETQQGPLVELTEYCALHTPIRE